MRTTARIVAVLVLGAGVSVSALAQPLPSACSDGQCIQIASCNIELLGSSRKPYRGVDRGRRTDDELDRLAERLATTLDLEVVVFEEINTHSDEWGHIRNTLQSHGYHFEEGTTSERDQYVVLAWDADEVTLLDDSAQELDVRDEFHLPGGCHEEGMRKPVAAHLKAGEFDFWVIGVHLKSRTGTARCTSEIRTEQCKDLVEAIDQLEEDSGESDIIIVGDCNERIGHPSFAPLVDAGFTSQMRYLTADSAGGSYIKTADLNESDDLIDHVWIRFGRTQEVVRRSASVMKLGSAAEARQFIMEQSDHVPVWVSFRVDEDLDEEE